MATTEDNKTSRLVCKILAIVFVGTFMPKSMFTPVYYHQIGLSPTHIGVLHSSMRFSNAIGAVVLGYAADRFDKRKSIFVISSVVYAAMPVLITLPQPNYLCAGKPVGSMNEHTSYSNVSSANGGRFSRSGLQSNKNINNNNDISSNSIINNYNITNENNNNINNNVVEDNNGNNVHEKDNDNVKGRPQSNNNSSNNSNFQDINNNYHDNSSSYHNRAHESNNVSNSTHGNRKSNKNKKSKLHSNLITNPTKTRKKGLLKRSNSELQTLFIVLLSIIIIGELIDGVAKTLMETVLVTSVDDKKDYPKLRLWGSIGQGVIVPLLALAVYLKVKEVCGVRIHEIKAAFYIMTAISCFGVFVIIFKVHFPSSKIEKEKKKETKAASLKEIITPLANWSLFVSALFYGISSGTSTAFLLLTMATVDPDNAVLAMGIAIITRNFIASFVYTVSPQLLRKAGYGTVMVVAYIFFASGFMVIAFMETVWLGILAESLEIAGFALAWSACVSYTGEIAHPSLAVTAQSILQFMFTGVGPSIGPLMAGVLLDHCGRKITFSIFSIIAIIAMIFTIIVQLILWRRSPPEYQPIGCENEHLAETAESNCWTKLKESLK